MSQLSDQLLLWINDLDAPGMAKRQEAERCLLDHGDDARALLRRCLELKERPLVAAQAALLLVRLGDRAARVLLVKSVAQHARPSLRSIFLRAAADLASPDWNDDASMQALRRWAADDDDDVRVAARTALQRSQPPSTAALAVSETDLRDFMRLAAQGDLGIWIPWIEQLANSQGVARQEAERALAHGGRPAQHALVEALTRPSARQRQAAVQMLQQLPSADASGALLMIAANPDESADLRTLALRALARCLIGVEVHIVDDLIALSDDRDRFVRAAAAAVLGRLSTAESSRRLIALLADPERFVVEEAARSLGRVGVTQADLKTALQQLRNGPPSIQAALLRSLSADLSASLLRTTSTCKEVIDAVRGFLASDDSPRVTATLSLIDRCAERNEIPHATWTQIARLANSTDDSIQQAALALLASRAPAPNAALRDILSRVNPARSSLANTLLQAARQRLSRSR